MTNYNNITVIIPAISFNFYLKKCIESIFKISELIKIIIICDVDSNQLQKLKENYNNLEVYIETFKLNISQKRNLGVKNCKTKFIAFIDSDAYPEKNWIANSLTVLENKKDIYIIGGPNISPEQQDFQRTIIGEVQKSFLITGKWNFQKRLSVSRFSENLYSCNMIMLKSTYIENHGMNESLNTGEDYDFCNKVNDNKKRIFFNQNSIVYHYDRNFKNFFIQKLVRGSTIIDQIKSQSKLYKDKTTEFYFYQLMPLYFIIFLILSSLILMNVIYCPVFIKTSIKILYFSYFILVVYSSRHIEKKNIVYFLLIIFFVILGNILIGIGSFLSIFKINNIYKLYKNS